MRSLFSYRHGHNRYDRELEHENHISYTQNGPSVFTRNLTLLFISLAVDSVPTLSCLIRPHTPPPASPPVTLLIFTCHFNLLDWKSRLNFSQLINPIYRCRCSWDLINRYPDSPSLWKRICMFLSNISQGNADQAMNSELGKRLPRLKSEKKVYLVSIFFCSHMREYFRISSPFSVFFWWNRMLNHLFQNPQWWQSLYLLLQWILIVQKSFESLPNSLLSPLFFVCLPACLPSKACACIKSSNGSILFFHFIFAKHFQFCRLFWISK